MLSDTKNRRIMLATLHRELLKQVSHFKCLLEVVILIHINSLHCISAGEYYGMILVFWLSLPKLWIARQFDGINFLVLSMNVSFNKPRVILSAGLSILNTLDLIDISNSESFIPLH
uniref:Uncharacterized protein n=1 Tax=Arundo donax TaxID=35708 RepID=A0A0A9CVR4_ARUDO